MYGTSVGSLSVYLVTGSTNKTLWTLSGNHQDNWFNAQAGIRSQSPYTVSIFIPNEKLV